MYIEHFLGKEDCNCIEKIPEILRKQTDRGVNEFWISLALTSKYPNLCVLTKRAQAYVHYFENENEPGVQSISDNEGKLIEDGLSVFYTNTDQEGVTIENRCIIDLEKAIEVVTEFYNKKTLPKCIEWEEL